MGETPLLTLILGRAGTGKTIAVMEKIKQRIDAGEAGAVLIVPEQYSHDAERKLCDICGDKLSLFGEVLSFTGLCRLVFSGVGRVVAAPPDAGGLVLMMHSAFESVAHKLSIFGARGGRIELVKLLLDTAEEFKNNKISPEILGRAAEQARDPLSGKLRDLALIFDAYNALLCSHGGDKSDRLKLLTEVIGDSPLCVTGSFHFDGFSDFTEQELLIIEELLRNKADVTVCLTCDPGVIDNAGTRAADSRGFDLDGGIFETPGKTAKRLLRSAGEYGVKTSIVSLDRHTQKAPELAFLDEHLFSNDLTKYPGQCRAITVYPAPSRYTECEYAASRVWELIRSGYRWRDIAVMSRNWEEYGPICEAVFEKYGIPYFSSGRTDILGKSPVALICTALEIVTTGWGLASILKYIKTGFLGVDADDLAELENYAIKWGVRGTMWQREWTLPPGGYGAKGDDAALGRINSLRLRIVKPLTGLHDGIRGIKTGSDSLRALYDYMESIEFPRRLKEKAEQLDMRGDTRLAGEYVQLFDAIVNAMEQMHSIIGAQMLGAAEFCKLFALTMSQYDVGVIPVSIDRTALGGMAMSRRRELKCLILLGASDENIPMLSKCCGALSDNERADMEKLGAGTQYGLEERLNREMNMLYLTLTLPARELVISYPAAEGGRPSFIIKRIRAMFGIEDLSLGEEEYMTAAEAPCFELAMLAGRTNNSAMAYAAREYFFSSLDGSRGQECAAGASMHEAGPVLAPDAAKNLYGSDLLLSATSVDRYYSCPYSYFLANGLGLNPRIPAVFDAPTAGLFVHYVLENVSREIKNTTGFKAADAEICRALTSRYIENYVNDALYGFEYASARTAYLFRRNEADVMRIVDDTLSEIKRSDFEPLDFELDFSKMIAGGGEGQNLPNLRGFVDRVDGWKSGGTLYLRVIDYKTGAKSFNLSDVLYGRNMQMLIYLFALSKSGSSRYGENTVPAGVLYVPARDKIVKAPRNASDEEVADLRARQLRRDGLVLSEPVVIEAMENGDVKKYLPVKRSKNGETVGDSLVSREQIGQLSGYVDRMLRSAESEIRDGTIDRRPYYKNANENACQYCIYHMICGFDREMGDKPRFARRIKSGEVWDIISAGGGE